MRNESYFLKPFIIRHILFVILFVTVFLVLVINRLYQAIADSTNYELLLGNPLPFFFMVSLTCIKLPQSR